VPQVVRREGWNPHCLAREPGAGMGWVLGLDPSFSSDPSGIAVVDRSREDRKRLVVSLAERWQPAGAALNVAGQRPTPSAGRFRPWCSIALPSSPGSTVVPRS
jgi:hypothetical protein